MHKTRSTMKVLLAMLASLGLLCVSAGAAFARPAMPFHAAVLSSDPAIGSTIAQAPTKVTVFTAENINPDPIKSNLQVYGPSAEATNALISQGNAQVPLSNQKEMSISITPTAGHSSGVYIVFWKTVSADDGDHASGSFIFTVNPTAASSTPTAAATKTTTPATTSSNNTATANGAPVWVPIVAALVALLVGLGAGFGLGRRKPAASSIGAMRTSIAQEDKEASGKRP